MALIKCKECGGQVAKSAKSCPSCGAKLPKKVGVLGWAFALIVVLPIAWSIGSGTSTTSPIDQPRNPSSSTQDQQPAGHVTGWKDKSYTDSMTEEQVKMVSIRSINTTAFEFPYNQRGGSGLELYLRRKSGRLEAFMIIDKGQMVCGVTNCQFQLKIADQAPQSWTGNRAASGMTDTMFIRDAGQIESIIKSGQPLRIGIDFYRSGIRTFDFETDGYPGI